MRRLVLGLVLAGFMVLPTLTVAAPAAATVPGENGRLVYVDQVEAESPGLTANEIFTMNPDGSDVQRLTHDAGRSSDDVGEGDVIRTDNRGPRWSPDGLFIAYIHTDEWWNHSVRLMDADGTFIRAITDDFDWILDLAWSPDGSQLVINGSRTVGDGGGLWTITEAGTNPNLLVPDRGPSSNMTLLIDPDWSPDGEQIVFSAQTGSDSRDLITTDTDKPIAFFGGPFNGDNRASHPRWTASGDRLIYAAHSDEAAIDSDIWETPYPEGTSVLLIDEPGNQHTPTPSPSGNDLYYISETDQGLWSQTNGRIADFSGSDLDWQSIQRIPHSLGLVDPATGKWYLTSLHGMVYSFYYGNPGDYPMMGDWDCTGTDTPGLYRQSDGAVYLRNSNTQGVADLRFFFGNPGDIPLAGDFNGDGCDTVSIYRPSEGRVFIINSLGSDGGGLGAADYDFPLPETAGGILHYGDESPLVGDFDGDGISTVAFHREATGRVYFRNTNTEGNVNYDLVFGNPGDRMIAGDWSHNGRDTPAVYRPSNRTFYLSYILKHGNADEQYTWGQSRWLPVTGYFGPP
jgi:Tol biopolymer transport system component